MPPTTIIQEIAMLLVAVNAPHKLLFSLISSDGLSSRPPLHAPVALDHVLDFLLCDAIVLGPGRKLLAKKNIHF